MWVAMLAMKMMVPVVVWVAGWSPDSEVYRVTIALAHAWATRNEPVTFTAKVVWMFFNEVVRKGWSVTTPAALMLMSILPKSRTIWDIVVVTVSGDVMSAW